MQELVSVIIPVFNAEDTIARCLWSVINQSYKRLEIIVVSDGSRDSSDEIVHDLLSRDSRIKLFCIDNVGPGLARNYGISKSNGAYISFLDADDEFDSHFIEKLMDRIVCDESDMAVCDIMYIDELSGRKEISKIRFGENIKAFKEDSTVINKLRTFIWGKIYSRELLKEVEFSTGAFEDLTVSALLAVSANRISYIDEALIFYYRNRENSVVANDKIVEDLFDGLMRLIQQLEKREMYGICRLEVKKLLIGQLRFLYKKFSEKEDIEKRLVRIIDAFREYFPELEGYNTKTFYCSSPELRKATTLTIWDENQLILEKDIADYIISDERCVCKVVQKNIVIPDSRKENWWEIAEYIMENL